MYGTNPNKIMGVFAYNWEETKEIGNPIEFLNNTSGKNDFLQKYALENDVPFVLFGD